MGSIKIRQAFPLQGIDQVDPFILLHHFDLNLLPGDARFTVPAHPHRGFCPITFMFEGEIEHEDSLGNHQTIGNDEVQWINAGRGIIHSEKASKEFTARGGRYQGIQLWLNLHSSEKMKTPTYQPLTKEEIVLIERDGVEFRLVSGKFENHVGPAHSTALTAMMRMQVGGQFELNIDPEKNLAIYILEGEIKINDKVIEDRYGLIHFKNEGSLVKLEATQASKLLIMSGTPLDEPKVSHGPFVMNTQIEIMEAMRDYQNGKMGFLY